MRLVVCPCVHLSAANLAYQGTFQHNIFFAHLWVYAQAPLVVAVIHNFWKTYSIDCFILYTHWLPTPSHLLTGQWGLQVINNCLSLPQETHGRDLHTVWCYALNNEHRLRFVTDNHSSDYHKMPLLIPLIPCHQMTGIGSMWYPAHHSSELWHLPKVSSIWIKILTT